MVQTESLSINEIIKKIKNHETFEAVPTDKSFHLKIRSYLPFICAAIHAGSNFRGNLTIQLKNDKKYCDYRYFR